MAPGSGVMNSSFGPLKGRSPAAHLEKSSPLAAFLPRASRRDDTGGMVLTRPRIAEVVCDWAEVGSPDPIRQRKGTMRRAAPPPGPTGPWGPLVGNHNRDMDATREIISFFRSVSEGNQGRSPARARLLP